MDAIVKETNRYAIAPFPLGRMHGGANRKEFMMNGLKAFMAMALYMGMKNKIK